MSGNMLIVPRSPSDEGYESERGERPAKKLCSDSTSAVQDVSSTGSMSDARKKALERKWCMDDFVLGTVIGCGRFGKVLLATEKESHITAAMKIITKSSIVASMKNQVFHELAIHSLLKHPNIIPLYTYFHNEQSICLVMEYATGNSLHSVMQIQKYKRFSEGLAAKYICQVARALEHMHCRMWMHRDVKPENVFIDRRGNAKLGDFGYAWSSVRKRHGVCGTHEYMAPEVVLNKPYDHTVDIWCLGVMAYELLVGRDPFRSNKPKVTEGKILQRKIKFPAIVKPDAIDLILKLINVRPKKRMTATETISHVWVTKHYKTPDHCLQKVSSVSSTL